MVANRRRHSVDLSPGQKTLVVAGITLVIGLGLGALSYRLIHHSHRNLPRPAIRQPQPVTTLAPPPPLPKPKGPAPGLPAATQFDFYTILPEIHRKPERTLRRNRPSPRHPTETSTAPAQSPETKAQVIGGRFILQAASFPDLASASRLRAELALRGLASYIEKVSITGRGAFYRVRLGPLHKDALGHDRKILARLGLTPILLREARGN